MQPKRKKPLKRLLRHMLTLSPREFAEYEPRNVAEEMMLRTLGTAIRDGRNQLGAFNSVWDRAEGPVGRDEDGATELHIKVIGSEGIAPESPNEGDKPYGAADRHLAEERARGGADPAVAAGRGDLPGVN